MVQQNFSIFSKTLFPKFWIINPRLNKDVSIHPKINWNAFIKT